MRIVHAVGGSNAHMSVLIDLHVPYLLASTVYRGHLDKVTYDPEYLILDSGAFSAWNVGKAVDIHGYAEWALSVRHRSPELVCVNLDVIPGERGRTSTKQERVEAMRESMRNADWLRQQGLPVAEVFHQDEPLSYLDELVARAPVGSVICISPRNDVVVKSKLEWQRQVLAHLLKSHSPAAFPKFHGLAVTNRSMLNEFPYYSGDSSTWVSPSKYGLVRYHGKQVRLGDVLPRNVSVAEAPTIINNMIRHNVESMSQLERDITTLWHNRGVRFREA